MVKHATTFDEQISLLQERGMIIHNIEKAKEILGDIGYYRLGFYWFPFEKTYPNKDHRTHEYKAGISFDDVVKLYYFDFKLRSILAYYLNRIEINFRNCMIYTVSNIYKKDPYWFINRDYVASEFVKSFDSQVYNSNFRKNIAINEHHKRHREDQYAPAWKTLEYMTFGSVAQLYSALKDEKIQIKICKQYGINKVSIFENYLNIAKELRNFSAHGNVLFDFVPRKYIRKGPAGINGAENFRNLYGSIKVILYLLRQISENRYNDMVDKLESLIGKYSTSKNVIDVITTISGLSYHIENGKLKLF
jgi:abortive infection bacteriophage resistance protein